MTSAREENATRSAGPSQADLLASYGYDTAAGRILQELYGVSKSRAKVSYPKVKSKSREEVEFCAAQRESGVFVGNGKLSQNDPRLDRKVRKKQRSVRVPRRVSSADENLVVRASGKKSKALIEKELEKLKEDLSSIKLRPVKSVSCDKEKARLQAMNLYAGYDKDTKAKEVEDMTKILLGKRPSRLLSTCKTKDEGIDKVALENEFNTLENRCEKLKNLIETTPQGKARLLASLRERLFETIQDMREIDELLAQRVN